MGAKKQTTKCLDDNLGTRKRKDGRGGNSGGSSTGNAGSGGGSRGSGRGG